MSTSLGAPSSSCLHGKASQALFFSQLLLLGKNAKGKGTLSEAQGNKASGSSPQCSHKRIVDSEASQTQQPSSGYSSSTQCLSVTKRPGSQKKPGFQPEAHCLCKQLSGNKLFLSELAGESGCNQGLFLQAGRTEEASQSCGLSIFRPSIDRPLTKLYTIMSPAAW